MAANEREDGVTLGIVVSRADSASVHVGEQLLAIGEWDESTDCSRPDADGGGTVYHSAGIELRQFEAWHVELDGADRAFETDPDLLVFASRHSGDTGPLLSAHHTGNFGPAAHGGTGGRFARAAPNAHKEFVATAAELAPPDYEVATECTHHGPTDVETPSLFCELGSGEVQWEDPEGAQALARAILALRDVEPTRDRTLVGFGGGHYANRFLRVLRETDWAVGHVGAAWSVEEMGPPAENEGVLRRAMERSGTEYAVVDGRNPEVKSTLDRLGYRVVSETWIRESTGLDLELLRHLEDRLVPVDDGLRFGELATEAGVSTENADGKGGAITVAPLPASLLSEAQGIDLETTWEAVADRTLAFETEEGGSKLAGRVALPRSEEGNREEILEALTDVLAGKYDAIERGEEAIVARERAFDPEKARTFGIEEGPAFGRLAAGETVEVDGREIPPEAVHTERERRFPR
jgi:D-aminoacyl-tRNA deacylase